MAESGNAKHRYRYSSGIKAVETEKHGRTTARQRYGPLKYADGAPPPKDLSAPQKLGDPQTNLRGPSNDVKENSWLRGGGKGGESYRYFDRGSKRR